ncbi:uncharacterized protein LOC143183307 [Calliopsis andreniformis]|uniref:uncharacterized protein LOC143183307 n=1 Tax=Calliopsis andreniformis TaxID=337506 RepID=UPI003FCD708D
MSKCKCPKPDVKLTEQCPPYFESITTRMEERRCDLIGRRKYLKDKITTMERSIPALIAYNLWMNKDNCIDAPYCKVREMMKKFCPHPDQTERLLQNLKKTVKELNGETTQLHEKIIQADVKLEETGMELESLELANAEMNDTLNSLEKEMKSYINPSLHSIHSEDLICLSKIRQLAEEELCLKNCIKEMELKETLFKEHMDHLLTSKEYQSACDKRKMISCLQDLDCSAKNICCVPKKCLWHKPNGHRPKKKIEEESDVEQIDVIVSTSDHNVNHQDQESKKLTNTETLTQSPDSAKELKDKKEINDKRSKPWKTSSCKPCGYAVCPSSSSTDRRSLKKKVCSGKSASPCELAYHNFLKTLSKCGDPSLRKILCELPRCATAEHSIQKASKPSMLPCGLGTPCEICPSLLCKDLTRSGGNCRCNCQGKCARGLSDAECNCSDALLDPLEQYQPKGSKKLCDLRPDGSNSEDEYCECCSCGCEDNGASLCQCN